LKVSRDGAEVTPSGRLFQMHEAAVGSALSATVDSRVDGMSSADVDEDLSHRLNSCLLVPVTDILVPCYVNSGRRELTVV